MRRIHWCWFESQSPLHLLPAAEREVQTLHAHAPALWAKLRVCVHACMYVCMYVLIYLCVFCFYFCICAWTYRLLCPRLECMHVCMSDLCMMYASLIYHACQKVCIINVGVYICIQVRLPITHCPADHKNLPVTQECFSQNFLHHRRTHATDLLSRQAVWLAHSKHINRAQPQKHLCGNCICMKFVPC